MGCFWASQPIMIRILSAPSAAGLQLDVSYPASPRLSSSLTLPEVAGRAERLGDTLLIPGAGRASWRWTSTIRPIPSW